MSIACPKCDAINPQGAEICGDCGQILTTDSVSPSPEDKEAPVPTFASENERLPEISLLSKGEKRKAPVPVQILSGILFASGIVLLIISVLLLKADNSFIELLPFLSASSVPLRLISFLLLPGGLYALTVAHGISHVKKWGIKAYIIWVSIQVVLEILAKIYHHPLGFTYFAILLGELLFIPYLWRIKHRFY